MPGLAAKPTASIDPARSVGAVPLRRVVAGVNRWRDRMNPLRGLTILRAVQLLEAGTRGEFADLQWTYRSIERLNPTLRALIARRQSALLKLSWEIKLPEELPANISPSMAEEQRDFLSGVYHGLDNFRQALQFLALAEFRGFAHLQAQDLNGDSLPDHLEIVDQWNWVRQGLYGDWFYNQDARSIGAEALPPSARIEPAAFMVRTVDSPINECALVLFIRKSLAIKDWDSAIEIYGLPSWMIIGPPDVPPEREAEFQTAAEGIAEGGGGYLPNGSSAVAADSPKGNAPFQDHIRYQDEQLVLAGTGGMLTMLAESGTGTLAGGAHADTFADLAEAEAEEISEVFQRQFDARLLAAQFPGQPIAAYFELASKPRTDVGQVVTQVSALRAAGWTVDTDQIEEMTGFRLVASAPPAAPGAAIAELETRAADPAATDEEIETLLNRALATLTR